MRDANLFWHWFLILVVSTGIGCAKELSEEQLKRENRDRVMERVSGSIGDFSGAIEQQGNQFVPMELTVRVRTATEGGPAGPAVTTKPVVTMKTGLFGGVEVTTSDATYDSGRSELIARFSRSGRVTLELKGIVGDKGFEGTLLGNTSRSQRVMLRRGTSTTLSLPETVLLYQASYKMKTGKPYAHLPSLLTLRLNSQKEASPESFDLDEMPKISLSVFFHGQEGSAAQAARVAYDPLVSQMEVTLSNRVAVRFNNLGAKDAQVPTSLIPDRLLGTIYFDSNEVGTVEATRLNAMPNWAPMPSIYEGCLEMPAAQLVYPVSARLTDGNSEIINPSGILFPKAPALDLEITLLTEDALPYGRMIFLLKESDPMNSRLLFAQKRPSSVMNLDVFLGDGKSGAQGRNPWESIVGVMQTPRSLASLGLRPRLYLNPSSGLRQVPQCGPKKR